MSIAIIPVAIEELLVIAFTIAANTARDNSTATTATTEVTSTRRGD